MFVDVATSTGSAEVSIVDPPPPPGTVDGSDEEFWGAELPSEPCKEATGAGAGCESSGSGFAGGVVSDMGRGGDGRRRKNLEFKKDNECSSSYSIIDCQGR